MKITYELLKNEDDYGDHLKIFVDGKLFYEFAGAATENEYGSIHEIQGPETIKQTISILREMKETTVSMQYEYALEIAIDTLQKIY